jgi:hypothetical protein
MQSVQQKTNDLPWYIVAWHGLIKLDFIPAFFNWLMKALALITEPFASFSAIYIIIVAGVPSLLNNGLYTAAMALIIGSPELLIVGAFKIASRELAQHNNKAWWLMGACGVLLLLTAITVGDLFVWKWDQGSLNILMGVRCLAGIAYTFTRGVVTDDSEPVNVSQGSPVHSLLAEFTASIQDTVNQVNQTMVAEVNQIRQGLLTEVNRQHQQFVVEVHSALHDLGQHQHQLAATVNGLQHGVQTELQTAIEVLGQQSQTALDTAVERLERANSRRMEAVYTRLEQVKVTLESNPALPAVKGAGSPLRLPSRVHSTPISQAVSEPTSARRVHSGPVNAVGGNQPEPEGLLEGTKVDQGRQFAVNHYQVHHIMPPLATIMATVACGKTLASKARNRAAQDLGLAVSTTEE